MYGEAGIARGGEPWNSFAGVLGESWPRLTETAVRGVYRNIAVAKFVTCKAVVIPSLAFHLRCCGKAGHVLSVVLDVECRHAAPADCHLTKERPALSV